MQQAKSAQTLQARVLRSAPKAAVACHVRRGWVRTSDFCINMQKNKASALDHSAMAGIITEFVSQSLDKLKMKVLLLTFRF